MDDKNETVLYGLDEGPRGEAAGRPDCASSSQVRSVWFLACLPVRFALEFDADGSFHAD
jgi:hypothetical protein